MPDVGEHLTPGGRHKSIANPRHIEQILAAIVPNNQRIKPVGSRYIAADDEFLTPIHTVLRPRSRSRARFVASVFTFGNHSLQLLMTDARKHGPRGHSELLGNANVW